MGSSVFFGERLTGVYPVKKNQFIADTGSILDLLGFCLRTSYKEQGTKTKEG